MFEPDETLSEKTEITYKRLLPRLQLSLKAEAKRQPEVWNCFIKRLEAQFEGLFQLYYQLYADQYDFYYHLEDLLIRLAKMWIARPAELKDLDEKREKDPLWFQDRRMLGGVCYVDLFADNLNGIRSKIPYFQELGLTYLHLMPIFPVPEGENDGGYAVSSYRGVNPTLGTTQDLQNLAHDLRQAGISLVLDLVFNHTSDEHEWAKSAQCEEREYQNYYRIYPNRSMPDVYEATLREIFPDEHPGAFTFRADLGKWVWTTFHAYQWDLNYANPAVFNSMVEEMLYLANTGVEVLRLDAVAFIWKKVGTSCENLPEAHRLIQAFNAVSRIAAPALLFKSEAIVHPDEVARYITPQECQLSYNPLIMALLWNSLATRDVSLLDHALRNRFNIHPECAWVNYVRVHDDIGWTFSDEDAASLHINGADHRRFLNQFFTGRFPGSFGRGLPFQENLKTGDTRISGTCASLAGLEKALKEETDVEVELAIRRILLIHAVILTIGGIPLIYLGDEVGTLNDYTYLSDPAKTEDSRWVHRPRSDWEKIERRLQPDSIEGRIYSGLIKLISLRKSKAAFSGSQLQVINTDNKHILGYARTSGANRLLVFANFSEEAQSISGNLLRLYGLSDQFRDRLSGKTIKHEDLMMEPFGFACLEIKD